MYRGQSLKATFQSINLDRDLSSISMIAIAFNKINELEMSNQHKTLYAMRNTF